MESREIIKAFLKISKNWEKKYIGKGIIDEDIFVIDVVDKETKEYYIKNKYPQNWSSFILFRKIMVFLIWNISFHLFHSLMIFACIKTTACL